MKPKIAIVTISLGAGGTEKIVSGLANHLSQNSSVSIITLIDGEPFFELSPFVSIHSPRSKPKLLNCCKSLFQAIHILRRLRNLRPDYCFIFGENIAGVICLFARLVGIKRVFVLNRGTPARSFRGAKAYLNPFSYRWAERVILQTRQAVEILQTQYRNCHFAVIPNPVSIPKQVPPMHARKKRIIYVASLGRNKNQTGLIQAFAKLRNRDGWDLVLVGDGPDRPKLESLVAQLRIQDCVQFLGKRTDINELLMDSQLFAFPSLSEGFPNALAEALAAGCACVSYDCPTGPSELIRSETNGILVPNGDEQSLSHRLQQLISDIDLRTRCSGNARKMIRTYDEQSIYKLFDGLLIGSEVDIDANSN
jgi:GalNAc-alpha-(1->4)-GalNAc-alpha-(1->3)-diNAcBac-PP-undecaprenol alpha-1,4-N-acetyl-D-galactosaminyltransferase